VVGAGVREAAREALDREADVWRKDGGLLRGEMNVTRLEETQHMIAIAAEWLELDSEDEGIRFDSELVSARAERGAERSVALLP
jgi:protein arginine N-methyltransferase 5